MKNGNITGSQNLISEKIEVGGVHCAGCAKTVENAVRKLEGVQDVSVNIASGKVQVAFDDRSQKLERIKERITSAGFQVKHEHKQEEREATAPIFFSPEILAVSISGVLLALGLALRFFFSPITISLFNVDLPIHVLAMLGALIAGGRHFAPKGLRAVRSFTLDINFLMTLAIIGAILIGEYVEAASLAFLYSLAELLEGFAIQRARNSIKSLTELTPRQATVKRQGEQSVPVEDIQVGEVMIVRPGERVPLDGVVVAGESTVNQSPITGESIPIDKSLDDEVYAGSVNEQGYLEVRVTKAAKDTTLSRIIEMVEEAEGQRANTARLVDRFARYYTPFVVAVAAGIAIIPPFVLGGSFVLWFEKALTLLVIACPCALVISTPVAMISAITGAARNGTLVKGGVFLENISAAKVIAFDKTGTLTEGQLQVTDVIPLNGVSQNELREIAVALEQRSEHPIAQAIRRSHDHAAALPDVSEFQIKSGQGLSGKIEGKSYRIGSAKLFDGQYQNLPQQLIQELQSAGKTTMLVGDEQQIIGIVGVADQIRKEAKQTIQQLKNAGLHPVMISGDNELTARAIANHLGIPEYHAEMLPDSKVEKIKELQKKFGTVIMVGDGINDAPALATSDVGIAMGTAGSDSALETADVALMGDDLTRLPYLIELGRRTRSVIKQNLFVSLLLKLSLGAAVFPGWTNLIIAVLVGDMGASLAVIGNALRLARLGRKKRG